MRIWINYQLWEDHKAGLYSKSKQDEKIFLMARTMLEKPAVFFSLAMQMIEEWPNSANHNLSYFKSNRQSYLGQATACYYCGANAVTTCKVWEQLTPEQRKMANLIADEVIEYYEKEIYPKFSNGALDEKLS